ncbi:conjugative relaxase-like TrwC/TraI family protein [Kribbella orskensis]|uniref:Conjugative relaxase-like TrwC/TraI family protein n=1 Tax=Kribbella orskensis TaxID=2512216 RepID=A0ABY2B850_9ACTN|nr:MULTISPECIES: MobF family relaxase [Kribbella]TCN30658.1 conjugative relaxase-like TrwC/TraI family protein [Kribbella sp. VKM Ac-2500]TCO11377.1 conjugative relaxase-like TrwC/TraI family protein [Kribbella orskensis]
MLSIHRLTAGDGFRYLLKAVASGDVDRRMATPLTAYYTAAGYPAGRWAGSGLTGLGNGQLHAGQEVTEAQMTALFGRAEDPLTGRTLGRPYPVFPSASTRITARVDALEKNLGQTERENAIATIRSEEARRRTKQAVAGFDITFSPVKSVSALWATADVGVQEQIAAAHYRAIDEVIGLIERHAAFTRTGEAGVAQIDTQGVIATAFDHWDSRGGDPQLHTHLVIANRVQGIDGRWRTLDGRVLFGAAVALSEIHNVLLADELTRRLGTQWELRDRGPRRNPAFEIEGIPDELIREFSSRTEQIETNLAALLVERAADGPLPGRSEMYILRQQATLMNRPAKHAARPLADLMHDWSKRAEQVIPGPVASLISDALYRHDRRLLVEADIESGTIDAYGAAVVLALQLKRSTWTRWNILAEAARQTRLLRMKDTDARLNLLSSIAKSAERHSISLSAPELVPLPIQRRDGESVYTVHNGQIYTSPAVLGAESVLLDLAATVNGPVLSGYQTSEALGEDKAEVLHRVASSGQRIEAVVGPAGTGKTRLLAELKTAWNAEFGEGSVVALAPSAAAAEVLADSLDLSADNVAKWIHESIGIGAEQRRTWIAENEKAAQLALTAGRRRRAQRLYATAAAARTEHDSWRLRSNQLVIVDEASMVGTMELASLAREADKAGAKLLLVGDDSQLGAVDTGGAFRLLVNETHAAQLTEIWRFQNTWERQASLDLRAGNLEVLDVYDNHDRLHHGPAEDTDVTAYAAWQADLAIGRTSLLIAADNATVARLNARAHLDRVQTGEVEPDGVDLHDGTSAGLGDTIVTRLNARRLLTNHRNFVRNGATWSVIRRWHDGSLTVQGANDETVTLPSDYVRQSVELGYATTAHRAQGQTVDTAHLIVTDRLTRALLYVGMTRGRTANHAYVVTHKPDQDMHEPTTDQTMQDVLEAVLDQEGIERSAHEVMRTELDNATRLDCLIPLHEYLCQIATGNQYQAALESSSLDPPDQAAVKASAAYGPLLAALRRAETLGLDGTGTLHRAIDQSSLNNATDIGAVLHSRVERLVTRAERRSSSPPTLIAGLVTAATNVTDPQFIAPLREIESLMTQRADWLSDQVIHEEPPWYQLLPTPTNHQAHKGLVRELAAYRERYQVNGDETLGPRPQPAAYSQLRSHERLSRLLDTESLANESVGHHSSEPPTAQDASTSLQVGLGPDIN